MEYPKIETLFPRDGRFVVDTTQLRSPVLATIREWDVTEKIDGMNIRVMMDEAGSVTFGGRTDRAQLPADLFRYLAETFTADKMRAAFERDGAMPAVVLYGEGYGAGIQKGDYYRPDKAFRLFDVLVGGRWWLDWQNTCDVAEKLGIHTVPYLGRWTLEEIVGRVRQGVPSETAREDQSRLCDAEGIVGRTVEPLFDKRGKRLIIKLKTRDFGRNTNGC